MSDSSDSGTRGDGAFEVGNWRLVSETLAEFIRGAGEKSGLSPDSEPPSPGNLDDVWDELHSLHLLLDRRRERGDIETDRVRELRSRLLELSLRLARSAVEEESRSYQRLLRDVSHDIRSPLHSIIFLSEALYTRADESDLGKSQRRQLGTIYAAGTSLLNLVNDLLDYARMAAGEGGEVEDSPFTLDSVIADVRHLLGPLVEHYGTEFTIHAEAEGRLVGDRQLLCRILTNLVSNAIEAAGREGCVSVEIAPDRGGLSVEVVNDGYETDVEQIECLLSQPEGESIADCVGEQRQGRTHGLGLLICGRLLSAAGGSARVRRLEGGETGVRTEVTVWLPFGRESDVA